MIQIKLVCMSTISYCIKLHLFKCNDSWIVSIKQNMNFDFQPCSTYVLFLFCTKIVLLKVNHLQIYQHIKFNVPRWLAHVLYPPQKSALGHFEMVEATGLKVRRWGNLQRRKLPSEFHKSKLIGSNVIGVETRAYRRTDTMVISTPHFPFRKVG
jgi:hypothetical protein